MPNEHVRNRVEALQKLLIQAHGGGDCLSSASKGGERQDFIDLVLRNVIAPPFRFGSGDITDLSGATTGQLDIVIEYGGSISFSLIPGSNTRLYLAEGVCAVIEVKSDVEAQWGEVIKTAKRLRR